MKRGMGGENMRQKDNIVLMGVRTDKDNHTLGDGRRSERKKGG